MFKKINKVYSKKGSEAVIKLKGVNLEAVLVWAVERRCFDLLDLLIKQGVDASYDNYLAIQTAIDMGDINTAILLAESLNDNQCNAVALQELGSVHDIVPLVTLGITRNNIISNNIIQLAIKHNSYIVVEYLVEALGLREKIVEFVNAQPNMVDKPWLLKLLNRDISLIMDKDVAKKDMVRMLDTVFDIPNLSCESMYVLTGYRNMVKKYTEHDDVTIKVTIEKRNDDPAIVNISLTSDLV